MSDETDLMEELILLCEIRGELDDDANARTEKRIAEIQQILSGDDDVVSYDDLMDGDVASALASAGFGTDEDYGYFGEDE